ncbi:tetratricopeptide repeat protein [Solwaraspora sp. WMMD1047]|uniref:tetratricopeptide repeat protein n=1 Tax=Solwaraspora sp. WMMD1047 TaxID=3016102 RepID=UPI0024159E2B|nr:tetratricopeptide repeat protein [Solwaraspora sp. WMMD1047]MDG4834798.1 tetratricopeptide repeat protein [Solwaraspora sp. WMMD1047]
MTALPGLPGDVVVGGRRQDVVAGRDAYVIRRDLIINQTGVPPFTVDRFVDLPAAGLGELTESRGQPSRLLTARRQAIVFTGRTGELDALRRWRDDPAVRRVWAWHGPGGQGKTRLAQEWGRLSAAAGWRVAVAGHHDAAPPEEDAKPLGTPWRWLPAGRRGLLLLVDYAERWPVHDLLRLLADCRTRAPKVRVLLLARSVDWWPTITAELPRLGYTAGTSDGEPRLLAALAGDGPGRRVLFEAACQRFAEIYQPDRPARGWPGRWEPPGDLGDDRVYGTTLGIHMMALATVDACTRQTVPPGSAGDVTRYLLDRERAYWARLHGSVPDTVTAAARTVLLACLAGPQSRDDGIRLLTRTRLADEVAGQRLLDAHDRCYPPPGTGTVLEPMYPDRLAEDFIALSLPASPAGGPVTASEHADSWTAATLLTAHRTADDTFAYTPGPLTSRPDGQKPPAHAARILIFLAAAAGRHPHVHGWLHTLLTTDPALAVHAGGTALTAVAAYTSPALAETIHALLPERSLDLAPAAAVLAQHLYDHTDGSDEQLARHSCTLAIRLANTGRREQALAPAEEATGIYRRLAKVNPDAYLPDLAASLNNLGMILSVLGRREQALAPAEESTGIYRRLAKVNPDAHLPNLAASLHNLGMILSVLGRREQALAPAEEAVTIRRRLAEANPDAHLPNLATSLNNLGNRLSELGRREQALAPAEEATGIYRRLTKVNPDAHLPNLATSLNNLGMILSELGRREQALAPAEESTGIYRRLAKVSPDAYLPGLAMSLNNLGNCLSGLGRREQALAPAEEAVTIRRRLAEANPDAYLPDLAMSLNNLGNRLSELGRREQALAPAEEATGIYRRLAKVNPDAHLPDLAMSLHNLGNCLSGLGRREQALAPAEEATGIYRRLAKVNPDAHLPDLAMSLNNLGMILSVLGRREQALAPAEESTGIYRRLAKVNPDAYLPDLAASLNNLGMILSVLGRREQALAPAEESTGIYRRLAKVSPDAYLPDLAMSLWAYGWVCVNAKTNYAEALESITEAISLYEPLVRQLPQMFAGQMFSAYRTLADVLDGLGRTEEATELRQQLNKTAGGGPETQ